MPPGTGARRSARVRGSFLGACLALLVHAAAWAQAGDLPRVGDEGARSGAFREIPFHELLGVANEPSLAFRVGIPAHYRERRSSAATTGTMLWAAPADWNLIRQGRAATGRHGMLLIERSASLRYDPERREFRDGTGLTESNLPERLGRHGAGETRVRRLDRDGLPILLLESRLARGERLRVLYVHQGARTRTVTYIGRVPWADTDDETWARLLDSIAIAP